MQFNYPLEFKTILENIIRFLHIFPRTVSDIIVYFSFSFDLTGSGLPGISNYRIGSVSIRTTLHIQLQSVEFGPSTNLL